MSQAWSDKINNLFLLTVSSTDTVTPTAGSFATALSGGQNAAITAVVPYPSAPSAYFVQVLGDHTLIAIPCIFSSRDSSTIGL